jgi:hypothetical protein
MDFLEVVNVQCYKFMDFCGVAVATFSTPLGVHFLRGLANCLNVHVLTNTVRLRDERKRYLNKPTGHEREENSKGN